MCSDAGMFVWILIHRHNLKISLYPNQYLHVQSQQWKHQNNVWGMFKIICEKCHWHRSGVFIDNFEHISGVSIVDMDRKMPAGMAVQALKANTYLLMSYDHYDLEQHLPKVDGLKKANLNLERLFKVSLKDHTAFMFTIKYQQIINPNGLPTTTSRDIISVFWILSTSAIAASMWEVDFSWNH